MRTSALTLGIVFFITASCGSKGKGDDKAPSKSPGAAKAPVTAPVNTVPAPASRFDHRALWVDVSTGKVSAIQIIAKLSKGQFTAPWEKGMTLAHAAAKSGNLPLVKATVSAANIHLKDDEGWTPLHHACAGGHAEVVSHLIKEGAEVNTLTPGGESCLHLAARAGSLPLMTLLKGKGLSEKALTRRNYSVADYAAMSGKLDLYKRLEGDGRTANYVRRSLLHLASSATGSTALVEYLLKKSGGIQYKDRQGKGAIHFAAETGDAKLVAVLLKAGAHLWQQDSLGRVPLHYAAMSGNVETARKLLDKKIWLEQRDRSGALPLHYAARAGKVKMVQWLLAEGSKINFPDYRKRTPLHYAADEGHAGVVALLLAKGAEKEPRDKRGRTPLMYAADERRDRAIALLVEKGANVKALDHLSRTPLHHLLGTPPAIGGTAKGKRKERYAYTVPSTVKNVSQAQGALNLLPRMRLLAALRTFIAKGADLNALDAMGNTPVATVFAMGLKEAAELLVEKGADITKPNPKTGLGPIHYAVYSGNLALVEWLLGKVKGALTATTKDGRTLLHVAAMADAEEVLGLLLKKGARIEAVDTEGNTPLLLAGPRTAALLIEKGASGSAANKAGATGLHRAVMTGNKVLVEKLAVSREAVNKADSDQVTPLHLAVWTANLDIIKILLEKGADIAPKDKWGATPFMTLGDGRGSAKAVADIFTYMVSKGQKCDDTDKEGNTMAHSLAAASGSDLGAVAAAMKVCDATLPNKAGDAAVHIAVKKKNMVFLRALVGEVPREGSDDYERYQPPSWLTLKNREGLTPVQLAIKAGSAPMVLLMANAGANCRSATLEDGTTCVHVYASRGDLAALDRVKNHPGEFSSMTKDGRNAYHFAADKNRDTFMAHLVAKITKEELSFDEPDKKGRTPVFYAVKNARLAALQWFFSKKVDLARMDKEGNTLMHYAAMSGKAFIIKALKRKKLPLDVKNTAGKLPMDLVKARHLKKLLKP